MHDGHWNDGWSAGSWWWMAIMMIVFWGGIIWIAVALIRRIERRPQLQTHSTSDPPRATAQEILAERFARGEIDADEYRQRRDTLQQEP